MSSALPGYSSERLRLELGWPYPCCSCGQLEGCSFGGGSGGDKSPQGGGGGGGGGGGDGCCKPQSKLQFD